MGRIYDPVWAMSYNNKIEWCEDLLKDLKEVKTHFDSKEFGLLEKSLNKAIEKVADKKADLEIEKSENVIED